MKVRVKPALFSPVYEWALPLPAPIEESSTPHRGHDRIKHKQQGCFIIRDGFRRHESCGARSKQAE